jgi:flavodoxin I
MSKKILIIFSTVGGNTELVVDAVANLLAPDIFEITKKRPEISDPQEIKNFDLTILASPTYNQGTLEDNFKTFVKDFVKQDFSNQKFAIIGLGDSKYYPEYLTESASILEDIIKKTGGQMVVPALRIGVNPIKMLDKLVPKWVDKLKLADI